MITGLIWKDSSSPFSVPDPPPTGGRRCSEAASLPPRLKTADDRRPDRRGGAPRGPWRGSPSGAFDAFLVATRRPGPRARCARTLPHPTRRRGDEAEYEAAGRRRAASSAVFPTGRVRAGQYRGTVSAVHAVGISRNTRGRHSDRTPRCGRPGTPRRRSTRVALARGHRTSGRRARPPSPGRGGR